MQPTDKQFDDHRHDAAVPQGSDVAVILMAVMGFFALCLWLGVAWQMFFYVPQSWQLFDEFKMRLPRMAELVIGHFWWLVPIVILATLAACLASRSKLAWLFLLLALPILLNVVIFFSMYLPTQALLEGLNR